MSKLENFSAEYSIDPAEAERTKKAKRFSLGLFYVFFLAFLYTFLLVLDGGWMLIYDPQINILAPTIGLGSVILSIAIARTQVKYSDKALAYHYLALAIKRYNEGNIDAVRERLQEFEDAIDEVQTIPGKRKSEIQRYVEIATNSTDEAIHASFEDFFGTIVQEVTQIENISLDSEIEDIASTEAGQVTYRSIVRRALNISIRNYDMPFWAAFLVVILIGGIVFLTYSERLGMLLTLALLTGLQIYDRRNE